MAMSVVKANACNHSLCSNFETKIKESSVQAGFIKFLNKPMFMYKNTSDIVVCIFSNYFCLWFSSYSTILLLLSVLSTKTLNFSDVKAYLLNTETMYTKILDRGMQ